MMVQLEGARHIPEVEASLVNVQSNLARLEQSPQRQLMWKRHVCRRIADHDVEFCLRLLTEVFKNKSIPGHMGVMAHNRTEFMRLSASSETRWYL